jgi:hypothetical protein
MDIPMRESLDRIQYDWRQPLGSQPEAQAMSQMWQHPDSR